MKVLILSKYSSKGASSRYRFYNYREWFVKNGIHPTYKPLFKDKYLEYLYKKNNLMKNIVAVWYMLQRFTFLWFNSSKFDHVIIEAELFPKLPLWLDCFFLKKINSYSLDFDDNISANYAHSPLKNKIPELMKSARFVTVGNHWYYEAFEGNLIYLPTVIDLEKYPLYSNVNKQDIIVWIGSPSTVKYLKLIEEQLSKLSQSSQYVLKVIGGNIILNNKIHVCELKWSSENENKELSNSTVGIMPLENNDWENGKCGFKLIQYMASGLPVVASALPANREIVRHGINGFIAESQDEWEFYLKKILDDKNLANEMGKSARNTIEKAYSYQIWGDKYAEIIKNNM